MNKKIEGNETKCNKTENAIKQIKTEGKKIKQKFFLPVYFPQVLIKTLKRFLCTLINSDIFSPQRLLLLVRPC